MIYIACSAEACARVYRVVAEDSVEFSYLLGQGSDWYPDNYPCPDCGHACTISARVEPNRHCIDLTTQEAFYAFSGAGLPSEQECGATVVRNLIAEHGVREAVTRHISGTQRCVVSQLLLGNGWTIFLGSSVHGACAYRVKKVNEYVASTSNNHA